MKKFIVGYLVSVFLALGIHTSVFAVQVSDGAGKIHHFTIIAPPTAKVGEAIDITVEARDKDDKILTNYRGSVFFQSDTDFGAIVPAQGKAIQFKESDNGILKISKGVTFKRVGNQELVVTDLNEEDVGGSIRIRVEETPSNITPSQNEPITISTPQAGSTVTTDVVQMSGKTKKNSKIIIKLNDKEVGSAQSNEEGTFTFRLTGVSQENNVLTASVVDGANNPIGTVTTNFKFGNNIPTFYNISFSPGKEVEAGTGITITIDAEPRLGEVTASIDGALFTGREQSPGKYTIITMSPAREGSYPVQVTLRNMIGQKFEKANAETLIVKPKTVTQEPNRTQKNTGEALQMSFKNVTLTNEGNRVNLNFRVENAPDTLSNFKIAYGENPDSLPNEVSTFGIDKIRKPDGSYNWYIEGLEPKTYSFKIFGVMTGGTVITESPSETLNTTVGRGECSIGNIESINTTVLSDKTILRWNALSGAVSYNVYRITAAKDYELVENVKENMYTIYIASGSLVYEDFAVKALCDSGTESAVPAVASKVRTGPELITALVILSSLMSIYFIRRRWSA